MTFALGNWRRIAEIRSAIERISILKADTLTTSFLFGLLLAGCVSPRPSDAERHKAAATPPPQQPAPMPPPLSFQGEAPQTHQELVESAVSPLSAEQVAADETNLPKYALNLRVGMTLEQASAVFRPHPLKIESTASGENGSISIYRTLVISNRPEIWLTFYSGSLQSWATVAKH
jgi:hypothetical protein